MGTPPAPSSIVVTAAQVAIAYEVVKDGFKVAEPPPIVAGLNLAGVGDSLETALRVAVRQALDALEEAKSGL